MIPTNEISNPEPNTKIALQINAIYPNTFFLIEVKLISSKLHPLLTCKRCIQKMRTLAFYFETPYRQILCIEPLALVERIGLDFVEVDSHLLVGVSESDVEVEFVLKIVVVVCEIELSEFGIRDMNLEHSGLKDKPANEDSKDNDENQGHYGFPKAAKKATKAATAFVFVFLVRWWYRWAGVGTIQVGFFLCHC